MTWKWLLCFFSLFGLVCVSGCGGCGTTQSEMARYAISRGDDDDDDDDDGGKRPAAQQNNNSNNVQSPQNPTKPGSGSGSGTANQQPQESPQSNSLSDTVSPPKEPLGEIERREITIRNMLRIGAALEAYARDHGHYPNRTISRGSNPLLSWRVELLPYLGYQELYAKFDKTKGWSQEPNRSLVDSIPSVYQSPERFDTKTNYLAPIDKRTAFQNPGVAPEAITDGRTNTILFVEADNHVARPWSSPLDWPTAGDDVDDVGNLRGEGFFVILGGGIPAMVPNDLREETVKGLLSIDGGEAIDRRKVLRPADADPDQVRKSTPTGPLVAADGTPINQAPTGPWRPQRSPKLEVQGDRERRPVPNDEEIRLAKMQLREIWANRYARAEEVAEKQKIITEMTLAVEGLDEEPPRHYAILTIIVSMNSNIGKFEDGLKYINVIEDKYHADVFPMKVGLIRATPKALEKQEKDAAVEAQRIELLAEQGESSRGRPKILPPSQRTYLRLFDEAMNICWSAVNKGRFDLAEEFVEIADKTNTQLKETARTDYIEQVRDDLKAIRKLQADAKKAEVVLKRLPDDKRANLAYGRYLAFGRGDWDAALPHLAKGEDDTLRKLAEEDMAGSNDASKMFSLAQRYWELETSTPFEQRCAWLRAAQWFRPCVADFVRQGEQQEWVRGDRSSALEQVRFYTQDHFAFANDGLEKRRTQNMFGKIRLHFRDPAATLVLYRMALERGLDRKEDVEVVRIVEGLEDRFHTKYTFDLRLESLLDIEVAISEGSGLNSRIIKLVERMLLQAAEFERIDDLERVYGLAQRAARKTRKRSIIGEVSEGGKFVKDAKTSYAKFLRAKELLQQDPGKKSALLTVGEYLVVTQAKYEEGLSILIKSGNLQWSKIADADMNAVTDEERIRAGDLWWKFGEDAEPLAQKRYWMRAGQWYLTGQRGVKDSIVNARINSRLSLVRSWEDVRLVPIEREVESEAEGSEVVES